MIGSAIVRKINGAKNRVSEMFHNLIGRLARTFLLKDKEFTIISNNCWGGWVYRYYGIRYNSPTIGLFFISEDYLRFIKNLKYYLGKELVIISPDDAHDRDWLLKNVEKYGTYPVGRLDDVDIHFLHAKTNDQAIRDWNERKKRVNFNRIIVKFSTQNDWSKRLCEEFRDWEFPEENKLFFTTRKMLNTNYEVVFKRDQGFKDTRDEGRFYSRYVNITRVLNQTIETASFFEE